MTTHNPIIQARANKQLYAVEAELLKTLKIAREQGELSIKTEPETLAKYLMVNIWGLRVMAKSGYLNNDVSNSKKAVIDEVLSNLYSLAIDRCLEIEITFYRKTNFFFIIKATISICKTRSLLTNNSIISISKCISETFSPPRI